MIYLLLYSIVLTSISSRFGLSDSSSAATRTYDSYELQVRVLVREILCVYYESVYRRFDAKLVVVCELGYSYIDSDKVVVCDRYGKWDPDPSEPWCESEIFLAYSYLPSDQWFFLFNDGFQVCLFIPLNTARIYTTAVPHLRSHLTYLCQTPTKLFLTLNVLELMCGVNCYFSTNEKHKFYIIYIIR